MRTGLGFPEGSEGRGGPGGRYITLWIQQVLVQAVLHVLVAGPACRTRPRAVAGYARQKGRRQGCTRAGGGLCLSLYVGTDKIGREISVGVWGARLYP